MKKIIFSAIICICSIVVVLYGTAIPVYARAGTPGQPGQPEASSNSSPCNFVTDQQQNGLCTSCENRQGIWTAFGCLPTTSGEFVTTLLQFGSGIAGGIAFLLIIIGGFQIVMSAGNPEKLNEGKELITSAIVGLLFIIFSIFLLKLIGVDILAIPGFL
jgi:hypothetical protein